MNLADVADELAAQLGTILKGRTTSYAPDAITPPAGYVFGPETEYRQSYQNGLSRAQLAVTVAVPHEPVASAWKQLAGYISDTGATSVKACLESGTYTALHTLVVVRSKVGDVTLGGVTYKAAQFDIDITGSGV